MRVTIYCEQLFGVLEDTGYKLTIKVNENNSLLVAYTSQETAWQRTYLTLEELIQDNDLLPVWKWLARGIPGVPIENRKIGD